MIFERDPVYGYTGFSRQYISLANVEIAPIREVGVLASFISSGSGA